MAEIREFFNSMPPITRYWFGGSVAIPLLSRLGLVSPFYLILTADFLENFELWKPVTALFYYPIIGNTGLAYLMNLYFLYQYSNRLENGVFSGRPADYLFMLIFNWMNLVIASYMLGILMLMNPMVMSVLYVYCMINQDQIVSFWFGTRFKARYLPWAVFGVNFLLGNNATVDLLGIVVGHLYYFVMMKYPAEQGVTLLQTPQMLYNYLPSRDPATYFAPSRPVRSESSAATGTGPGVARPRPPTAYHWGSGRRLDD